MTAIRLACVVGARPNFMKMAPLLDALGVYSHVRTTLIHTGQHYDASRNMRDLGTPVFGKSRFTSILRYFPEAAELCVVRLGGKSVAAALLIHGTTVTEVPSASSLREYDATNANMVMYWHLLQRAIERGSTVFDFGRSSQGSGTYRFKAQWGTQPEPAVWQYYARRGDIGAMRPENKKYQLAIQIWRRLPVTIANLFGPTIVRGIP